MPKITRFEIHATRPAQLIDFYTELLGWSFQKLEFMDYWIITTGSAEEAGMGGGLLPRRGGPPLEMQSVNSFICTVEVEGLDALVEKTLVLGGVIALPQMDIPGMGRVAYIKDSDGNLLGLLELEKPTI